MVTALALTVALLGQSAEELEMRQAKNNASSMMSYSDTAKQRAEASRDSYNIAKQRYGPIQALRAQEDDAEGNYRFGCMFRDSALETYRQGLAAETMAVMMGMFSPSAASGYYALAADKYLLSQQQAGNAIAYFQFSQQQWDQLRSYYP
jgi:hypothetical protein